MTEVVLLASMLFLGQEPGGASTGKSAITTPKSVVAPKAEPTPKSEPTLKSEPVPKDAASPSRLASAANDAASVARATINYLDPTEIFLRGGVLMWPILLCSIVMVAMGLERAVTLQWRRVISPSFARRLIEHARSKQLTQATGIDACIRNGSPMAEIFLAALREWGKPRADIDRAINESGHREIAGLKRNLRGLQALANISTMLGLLGTVQGMIQAFNDVAASKGLGRAEVLANGIAQALLTTAFGLVVAIPAVFLSAYFGGRVERLVLTMDKLAGDLAAEIAGSGASATTPSRPSVAPAANNPGIDGAPARVVPQRVS